MVAIVTFIIEAGLAGPVLVIGRMLGLCAVTPVLGSRRLSGRLRVAFALVLALPFIPLATSEASLPDTAVELVIGFVGEFFVGTLIASFVVFIFESYRFVGASFDGLTGFSSSQAPEVLDGGGREGLVTRCAMLVACLVFLTCDGHHIVIRAVGTSFRIVPLGELVSIDGSAVMEALIVAGAGAFATALSFALPGFFFIMVIEFTAAIVARAFPEFQAVATDISLRRLAGLAVAAAVLLIVTPSLNGLIEATFVRLGLSGRV